jgi:hypothetical protein
MFVRWDSLPIIQSYVKQKLGETPEPPSSKSPKVPSPATPTVPTKNILTAATASVISATEAERWDPSKQLDKLKGTVISKLREQQLAKKQSVDTKEGESPPSPQHQPISTDDGN